MGTKSEQYCKLYRITNTKTGEVFEGRKWSNVVQQAGLKANYNSSTLKRSRKWKVEELDTPAKWNETEYRADLYAKTKDRYPNYEKRKAEKNPHYERSKRLFRSKWLNEDGTRYTLEQYNEAITKPCAVCKNTENLVVDHCHSTNIVRGTLCRKCNLALGFVEDNIQILYNLITYLEERRF